MLLSNPAPLNASGVYDARGIPSLGDYPRYDPGPDPDQGALAARLSACQTMTALIQGSRFEAMRGSRAPVGVRTDAQVKANEEAASITASLTGWAQDQLVLG